MSSATSPKIQLAVFVSCVLLGFAIFFPLINNSFLSDDFLSLHRLVIEKRIIYKGVFRPLIDISFYFNYLISGFNPVSYYIFNIFLHCINAFLVFKVAGRFTMFNGRDQFYFALLSGILFLIYPFHLEPIAWLTARLASIASCCGLLILYWSGRNEKGYKYFVFSLIAFFVALTGYESIILMPFIILAWTWTDPSPRKQKFSIFFAWLLLVGIYLVLRLLISEELTTNYSSRIYEGNRVTDYALKFAKTTGRLFLPPIEDSQLMIKLFAIVVAAIILIHWFLWKKLKSTRAHRKYISLLLVLVISLALPMAFGVSTRTSEADRLLYFPSAFLCMIVSAAILMLAKGKGRLILIIAISAYFLLYLFKNVRQWEIASAATTEILKMALNDKEQKKIFINVPDELEGTFVFREGFNESIKLNGSDSIHVACFNYLNRLQYLNVNSIIKPIYDSNSIAIYPVSVLRKNEKGWTLTNTSTTTTIELLPGTEVIYWDKRALNRVSLR
ncbi:MAG: hypothetical protein H7Y31_03265 [Chitinophagaceae bacterium]|nr:hypothetical protein [Chitinophagaceae bacterium]